MKDYSKGVIYKLVVYENPSLVYYGSTIQTLSDRLSGHKNDFKLNKTCTSKVLYETGFQVRILWIEDFPCDSKKELTAREGWYIINNPCVNKVVPGRTQQEYQKLYYDSHKQEINEYQKVYNEAHKKEKQAYDAARKDQNNARQRERRKAAKKSLSSPDN